MGNDRRASRGRSPHCAADTPRPTRDSVFAPKQMNGYRFLEVRRSHERRTHFNAGIAEGESESAKGREALSAVCSSIIPAAVHTCREARNHGLYQRISLDVDEQSNTDRRNVLVNLNIDLVNIGTSYMAYFIPIASTIKRLKFSRANKDEYWSEYEKGWLPSSAVSKKFMYYALTASRTGEMM
jgi:hypothetical protein